jgi:hypothetical protein
MSEANPEYQPVTVYDGEGEFLGYTIHHVGTTALRATHLYQEGEEQALKDHLQRLNHGADLSAYWPDNDDPEFKALLADPTFAPIEYTEQMVVDDNAVQDMLDKGELVPERDLHEDPTSGNIEWLHPEKLPMVKARVPDDPAAPQARMRKAAETIALKRLQEARSDGPN